MKKPTVLAILLVFFAFTAFMNVATFGAKQREWKGKDETVDGIKVVKNPREPLYGTVKLDLAEDLSIGKEDDPNLIFFGVRAVTADKQRNIYRCERRSACLIPKSVPRLQKLVWAKCEMSNEHRIRSTFQEMPLLKRRHFGTLRPNYTADPRSDMWLGPERYPL